MDKLFTKNVGGFPLVLDDLRQFFGRLDAPSEGIYQAFNNLFRGLGDNLIIQGVVASGTTPNVAITEGWVILNGELIKVDAQTGIDTATDNKFVKDTTFDPRGKKTFLNGLITGTYEKNRAVIQGLAGPLKFDANRIFNQWSRKVLINAEIEASNGVAMTLNPSATDLEKRIDFNVNGNTCYCNFAIVGANAASSPIPGIIIKLPDGIVPKEPAESTGNFRNSALPTPGSNEVVNSSTRILLRSGSFFTIQGDSILITPSTDGLDNFNVSGPNNINISGQVFFEIE